MSSLLVICLGWCSNFVGSESGQKQSVKLLQNMVYSTIQHPPPLSHTVSVYMYCTCSIVHLVWEGGGRSERRYSRGATVHKYCSFIHGANSSQPGSKIQTTEWMYLQSIKSVKHNAAKSVNRSILKKSRHIGFGVFIFHSSMGRGFKYKYLVATVSLFIFYFTDWYWDEFILRTVILLGGWMGGVDVKWSGGVLVLKLHWRERG